MKIYGYDFETSKTETKAWPYLWSVRDICNTDYIYGRDIESFMQFCFSCEDESKFTDFNLMFDGSFIVNWLLRQEGVKQVVDEANYYFNKSIKGLGVELALYDYNFKNNLKKAGDRGLYFKVGINDLGVWYRVEVWYDLRHYTFTDATKLFPGLSLEEVGERFL